jgi:AraC-like DNA-binding protein
MAELAQAVNLSPSRLRHLFKDQTGLSLTQYLKVQRMQKAKELLETTFLSVKEVMLRVGFKDKSNFSQAFKKLYGLSPVKYRSQYFERNERDDEEDSQTSQPITIRANK